MRLLKFRAQINTHNLDINSRAGPSEQLGDQPSQMGPRGPADKNTRRAQLFFFFYIIYHQLQGFHYLEKIPHSDKKKCPTKQCHVCNTKNLRRESNFICPTCPTKPALCIQDYFKKNIMPIFEILDILQPSKRVYDQLITYKY